MTFQKMRNQLLLGCIGFFIMLSFSLSGDDIIKSLPAFSEATKSYPVTVRSSDDEKHNLDELDKLKNDEKPIKVTVGIYVLSLDSFNYINNTFGATFWVWFVFDEKYINVINPHKTVEVMNFISKEVVAGTVFKETKAGKVWCGKKIRGTFKHNWDLSKFPNDTQGIQLRFDESDREVNEIKYTTDSDNCGWLKDEINIPGWSIDNEDFKASTMKHKSTYGDPGPKSNIGSEYATFVAEFTLKRSSINTFLKLNFVVFVAFLISWMTLFIKPIDGSYFGARIATLVAMIYAIVLNIQYVDNVLGSVPVITLTDKIQLLTLIMVLIFFASAVLSYYLHGKKKPQLSRRIAVWFLILSPFIYVMSILLILQSII